MVVDAEVPVAIPARAWVMLGVGVTSQAASTVAVTAPAFLIPLLHTQRGMPLAEAGLFSVAPGIGVMLTLIAWGYVVDRYGEKWVLAGGLCAAAGLLGIAATMQTYLLIAVFCGLAGAASAGTNGASGRVVVGWFPRHRRGLAMGIRQMAQPLGVMISALAVPSLAERGGIPAALLGPAGFALVVGIAAAILVMDPPRAAVTAQSMTINPYRLSWFLPRIHLASLLLVVPQFTLSTFGLVWLVTQMHFGTLAAGAVIAAAQLVGAFGRIGVGVLSDRVGSRVRPLRWVAVSALVVMVALAVAGAPHCGAPAAIVLIVATAVSVADNGLSFTAVAEMAGPAWSGRALGIQNTGQTLASSLVGPVVGLLITSVGYPLTFALVALCPATAIPLVPDRAAETDHL
jgi:MFS family permease